MLDLTESLRSHLAQDVQEWVKCVLNGDLELSAELAERVHSQGFLLYLTRDLEHARSYVRDRYEGEFEKRYGLLASSKARDLSAYGIFNDFYSTQRVKVERWYNDPPDSPLSCCQLKEVVTEFSSQGLELDMPIVCWGKDLYWSEGGWASRSSKRSKAKNPHQLRVNSYRVLLSRGRDGLIVFVPPATEHESIAAALMAAGIRKLSEVDR